MARIDAEDIVSRLQEQLAEVQKEEVSARQSAETRLVSLSQEYESLKDQVRPTCPCVTLASPELFIRPPAAITTATLSLTRLAVLFSSRLHCGSCIVETVSTLWLTATTAAFPGRLTQEFANLTLREGI